jgi:hypothetical protein
VVAARTGAFYGKAMTAGDIYTVAGRALHGFSGDGGPATAAKLNGPEARAAQVTSGGSDHLRWLRSPQVAQEAARQEPAMEHAEAVLPGEMGQVAEAAQRPQMGHPEVNEVRGDDGGPVDRG